MANRYSTHRRQLALATATGMLAALAVASLTPVAAHAARRVAAPALTERSLSSSSTKVVSSKHHKLAVGVNAYQVFSGTSPTSVNVRLSTRNFNESHTFSFPIPASALKIAKTGKGSVKLASTKIGKYGKLSLHFAPYGKQTVTKCQGQVTSRSRKVTLSGTFFFDSRSGKHGWGTVGKRSGTFHFATINTVNWYYSTTGCTTTFVPPCSFVTNWSGAYKGNQFSGGAANIFANRTVTLAKPHGASRNDSITSTHAAATLKANTDGSDTMSIKGTGGAVSGSASITSSAPGFKEPGTCGSHSTPETTEFWSGPWKNGSTPLMVKGQLYPAIKIASDEFASFSKVSKGVVA